MNKYKRNSGVTLLEVNLALGVLLFGVVSVSSLFPTGLRVAEQGYRATDAALIASMAKAQVEMLSRSSNFKFPKVGAREGRLEGKIVGDIDKRKAKGKLFDCVGLKDELVLKSGKISVIDNRLGWTSGAWANTFVMMTSGGEAGRLFPVTGNAATVKTQPTDLFMSDLKYDLSLLRIHDSDSFRIIYNTSTLKSIPSDFISSANTAADTGTFWTIPTINGIDTELVKLKVNKPEITLDDIRKDGAAAAALDRDSQMFNYVRYTYAVVLDGPEGGSPNLFRAYVLIYKNYIKTMAPWNKGNPAPVEYYPFFYRRPSL